MSISGTSASDVYAVGADPGDGSGPYVLHYNGTRWRRLDSGAAGDLWWISVTPVEGAFYLAGAQGKVLRLDTFSQHFTSMETPGAESDTAFGAWAADGENVWAVGGDLDRPDESGFVWYFDGSSWTEVDVTGALSGPLPILFKVWGRSARELYAVGRLGVVLRYDGSAWSRVEAETTRTLFTVHGNNDRVVAAGGFSDAVILELDGNSFVDRAPPATPQMNGVFMAPDGSGVTVGIEAAVARRSSNGWMLDQPQFDSIRDFHAAWIDPDGGVWAVGGNLSAALDDGILAYIGSAVISTSVDRE